MKIAQTQPFWASKVRKRAVTEDKTDPLPFGFMPRGSHIGLREACRNTNTNSLIWILTGSNIMPQGIKHTVSRAGYAPEADIAPTVRPAPYHSAGPYPGERELARALRGEFVPLLRRRLPWHHLCGLPHGSAPRFVAQHRKRYPCFLRSDVRSFYPSVRHQDLVVGVQLAYRDLLGLTYVPSRFKQRYLSSLVRWCESLPLRRGIPLGSALSALAAPLMLMPLWLELRRRFGVPVMVFMDDVLVCCRDSRLGIFRRERGTRRPFAAYRPEDDPVGARAT